MRTKSRDSKLYQIIWKVIDQQYGQNLGSDTPPAVVDVIAPLLAIDHDLRIWERELPEALQTITSGNLLDLVASYNPTGPLAKAQRFRIVLTLRYLNVTLLLHRPVLVKYFELASLPGAAAEMALLSRLGRNSIDVCFRNAMEIISIVNTLAQNTGPAKYLLNVWWFTLYYSKFEHIHAFSSPVTDTSSSIQCRSRHCRHHACLSGLDGLDRRPTNETCMQRRSAKSRRCFGTP